MENPNHPAEGTQPARRPTMKDVARMAGGVHPSTVSLALRNSPFISRETRERVQSIAVRIGYRPDPLLDAYNHHRKQVVPHKSQPVIAFISDFPSREALLASPAHKAYWEAGRRVAEFLHCKLELFLAGPRQLGPERLQTVLNARSIDCVIVAAVRGESPLPAQAWSDFSAVRIECPQLMLPSYGVAANLRQAALLACENLSGLGYSRTGLVLSSSLHPALADQYLAGWLLDASRRGLHTPSVLRLPSTQGETLLKNWISDNRIQAVLSDIPTLGSVLATQRPGHSPAFACLDLSGAPEDTAGIVADHAHVGEQALRLAVGLMRANDRGPAQSSSVTYLPCTWRDGTSAKPFRQ